MATFSEMGFTETRRLFWHPEIEVYDPPSFPDASRHAGPEAVERVIQSYLDLGWDGEFRNPEFWDAGGEVLIIWEATTSSNRGGPTLQTTLGHLLLFKDGRIRRIRQYLGRKEALEAAGLSE